MTTPTHRRDEVNYVTMKPGCVFARPHAITEFRYLWQWYEEDEFIPKNSLKYSATSGAYTNYVYFNIEGEKLENVRFRNDRSIYVNHPVDTFYVPCQKMTTICHLDGVRTFINWGSPDIRYYAQFSPRIFDDVPLGIYVPTKDKARFKKSLADWRKMISETCTNINERPHRAEMAGNFCEYPVVRSFG